MRSFYMFRFLGALFLAGAILVGCSKATDSLKPQTVQEQEPEEAAFTLVVDARGVATKALLDNGETLGSEWRQGDSISVYPPFSISEKVCALRLVTLL